MKNRFYKSLPVMLLAVISVVVTLICFSCSSSTSGGHDEQARRDVDKLVSNLEDDGFIVQEGGMMNVNILKLVSEGYLPSAYGNNAGAPYLIYILPPAPGQNPSQGQDPPVGYDPDDPDNYPASPDIIPPGSSVKLRPDEAIILVGKTPPQATYFGYTAYLGLRENIPGKDYTGIFQPGNDEVGHYHRLFASLEDTLNPMTLKTSNTPDGQTGNAFNSHTVIISTADKGVNQRVQSALVNAGYPSSETNTQVIPSDITRMGLEKGKDTFIFLHRISIWADSEEGQKYLNNPDEYVRIFRITPATSIETDPYPVPELINRGTGTSEFVSSPWIEQDMETIRQGILQQYASDDYTYTEFSTSMWLPQGYVGIANDTDELADNNDAIYLKTGNFQFNSDDDFVVAYGIDHKKTGKATYNNISFYGVELLNGIANLYPKDLENTATRYFPEGYEHSDYYYAHKIGRKKANPDEKCLIVPYSTGNPDGFAFGVDNDKDAFIAFRVYLEPETKTGPSYFEIMYDRVILFKKK